MTSSSVRRISKTGPSYLLNCSKLLRLTWFLMATTTMDSHQEGMCCIASGRMSSNDASRICNTLYIKAFHNFLTCLFLKKWLPVITYGVVITVHCTAQNDYNYGFFIQ